MELMHKPVTIVILAAGLGTRMKSRHAKVLHRAGGKTLLQHVVDTALELAPAERIFVVVGHQAVVHGCTIEDGALIGIGARVLDGAVVEAGAQIGAGAVVAPGHRIPAGHLALGIPARVVRPLTEDETRRIADTCERYVALKEKYRGVLPQD